MTEKERPAYAGPVAMLLGSAVELTMGNGEISTDYLGNPQTQYGKWINRETEERDDEQPSTDQSGVEPSGDS